MDPHPDQMLQADAPPPLVPLFHVPEMFEPGHLREYLCRLDSFRPFHCMKVDRDRDGHERLIDSFVAFYGLSLEGKCDGNRAA